jgi:hypothetical protein
MCLVSRTIVVTFLASRLLALPAATLAQHDADGQPPAPGQVGALLLQNLNVLRGVIRRSDDHYVVTSPGVSLRVRARDVQISARNTDEIYRVLAAAVPAGSAENHLRLAQWCIDNRLPGYAAREIMAAQDIDPNGPGLWQIEHRLRSAVRAAAEARARGAAGNAALPTPRPNVRTAARDPRPQRSEHRRRKSRTAGRRRPQHAPLESQPARAADPTTAASARPDKDTPGQVIGTATAVPPSDPFDPEIFNRRQAQAAPPADD